MEGIDQLPIGPEKSILSDLELDAKHPGKNDPKYLARRKFFYELSRDVRLNEKPLPTIQYCEEEHAIWSHVSSKLEAVHQQRASKMYLSGKRILNFQTSRLPQPAELHAKLREVSGMGIIPAEELIHFREFFGYLARGLMPCTQYLRHGSRPEYTPEPDMIHDVIGHIPLLANPEYVELIKMIGRATQSASVEQLEAFNRLYWFGIEFGLILEERELKVLGAGLLSSFGEMQHCFSEHVQRKPFEIHEVISTEYDPTRMQDTLFVISSFEDLVLQTRGLIEKLQR